MTMNQLSNTDLSAEIEGITGFTVGCSWYDPTTKTGGTKYTFHHFKDYDSPKFPSVAANPETEAAWKRYWDEKWRRFRKEIAEELERIPIL